MAPPVGYAPTRPAFQTGASTRLASAANSPTPFLYTPLREPRALLDGQRATVTQRGSLLATGHPGRSRACASYVRSVVPEFPRAGAIISRAFHPSDSLLLSRRVMFGGWLIESNSNTFRRPSGFKPVAGPACVTIHKLVVIQGLEPQSLRSERSVLPLDETTIKP